MALGRSLRVSSEPGVGSGGQSAQISSCVTRCGPGPDTHGTPGSRQMAGEIRSLQAVPGASGLTPTPGQSSSTRVTQQAVISVGLRSTLWKSPLHRAHITHHRDTIGFSCAGFLIPRRLASGTRLGRVTCTHARKVHGTKAVFCTELL